MTDPGAVPVEPLAPPVAAAATTPAIADARADEAGEPRPTDPTPTPPGTVKERFLQRSATHLAIGATVGIAFLFSDSWILGTPLDRAALASSLKVAVGLWLGAFGLHTWSVGLRAK